MPANKTDMTVPEMRQWLRNWVGKAVGQAPDAIDESVPMVELGLSSRDAVAMAADIEDMTGVTLSVAVAFQHPTIEALATRIVEGEPERRTTTATPSTGRVPARPNASTSRSLAWPRDCPGT